MAAVISLYLDENISPKVAFQRRRRGIDAITVRDLDRLGDSDTNHLQQAIATRRALVTCDSDFLALAASGVEHTGIVFGVQEELTIGDWSEH